MEKANETRKRKIDNRQEKGNRYRVGVKGGMAVQVRGSEDRQKVGHPPLTGGPECLLPPPS